MAYLDPDAGALRESITADTVAAPAAMTQAAITGGESPTEAEFNALRADVAALRGTVATLITNLKAAGLVEPV